MQGAITSSKKGQNLKKDFRQFFIEQTGTSVAQQGQFQEIDTQEPEDKPQQQDPDEFVLQDDEPQQEHGIKTSQFWSQIKAITNAPKKSLEEVKWQVNCPMSFGFNSLGRDNIVLIDNELCKAAGCLLIYNKIIYQKHHFKVSTLSFNKDTNELLSATQGQKPQLFLWKFDPKRKILSFSKRFSIGRKCESIYALSFLKSDFIVAVQKFTFHKGSTVHVFNKNDEKKKQSLKVKKFFDMQTIENQRDSQPQNQRLFFANDEGIYQFKTENEDDKIVIQTELLLQNTQVTCLCPFYIDQNQELQIIYGDKEGKITSIHGKICLQVHQGWIFQIKNIRIDGINYFFSLGAIDSSLSVIKFENNQMKIIRNFSLGGYGRSIYHEKDTLLIGKRDGSHQNFMISQLIDQKIQKIARMPSNSLRCFYSKSKSKQFFMNILPFKKQNATTNLNQQKHYLYANQNSKQVEFFHFKNEALNFTQTYLLRSYPKTLDSYRNLIAYTYDVEKHGEQGLSSQTSSSNFSKISSKNQKSFQKSVLIVEDMVKKTLIHKISLKTSKSSETKNINQQKCTCVKFSPSGQYLVLGNQQGNIYLVRIASQGSKNQIKNEQDSLDLVKASHRRHEEQIRQIIWSSDSEYIKTTSSSQMFHWKIQRNTDSSNPDEQQKGGNKQEQNTLIGLKNIKANEAKDIKWTKLPRFGWETKPIWQMTGDVDDIYNFWETQHIKSQVSSGKAKTQISTQKCKIVGCSLSNGHLKIFNYPPDNKKAQQFILNNGSFQVCPYINRTDKFTFWVLTEGILILVQLSK